MRIRLLPQITLVFTSLVVFACAAGAQTTPAPAGTPDPSVHSAPYLLHSGDDLDIAFAYNPELNQHAPIRPDGRISMPMIGEVQAQGLSVRQFTEHLEASYAAQLRRTDISVQVRSFPNQVFYVGGEVQRPGVLPYRGEETSALQAIIEAGGVKESAATGSILLLRKGQNGSIEAHQLSLKAPKGGASSCALFALQPLDVLLITESRISKVDRAIDQYTRRISPVLLTGGFSYLFGNTVTIPK